MPLLFPLPSIVIHTDASLSGWGGALGEEDSAGGVVDTSKTVSYKRFRSDGSAVVTKEAEAAEG